MSEFTDIGEDLLRIYKQDAESNARLSLLHQVADELGLMKRDKELPAWSSAFVSRWGNPTISLHFHQPGIALLVTEDHVPFMGMVDSPTYMVRFAKELLPKVGKFEKEFDGQWNNLKLVATYKGVRIELVSATPKTCEVEVVEEEVVIPAKPETIEKRKRYILKGNCEPLMEPNVRPETNREMGSNPDLDASRIEETTGPVSAE